MKRGLGKGGFAQSLLITWLLTLFLVGRVPGTSKADNNDVFSPEKIIGVMRKVNTWQLGHPWKESDRNWIRSTYYTGVMALYKATGDQEVLDQAMNWGRNHQWQEGTADDAPANRVTCGQVYLELYFLKKETSMINRIRRFVDAGGAYSVPGRELWYYCDALYVAPPVLAMLGKATGGERYFEQMNEMYWDVVDYLYDKESSLFYRDERFLKTASKNGKKIFWSRGNGWVIAGIPRVLEYVSAEDPYRDRYVELLKAMAESVAQRQSPDGLWRTNLADPNEYPEPETSGSAFFCYAIAWGINHGFLDRAKYLPIVVKAWSGLADSVSTDGRLGWVQQVADRPGPVRFEDSHEYGTGAFLLAGNEVLKLAETGRCDLTQRARPSKTKWERDKRPLLTNFNHMYQPCAVETGGEYRFKMWFFGWAAGHTNPGIPGCDAIFHARSKDLKTWEVYSKDGGWDATMAPAKWAPVLHASERWYEAWHVGDPSVVAKYGRLYMAYSATSKPFEPVAGYPSTMVQCIMGATSDDGIHWETTEQPLLIRAADTANPKPEPGRIGDFHRPSLYWEDGKWRLWFDYQLPGHGACMGYAENAGEFMQEGGFKIMHDLRKPLLENWPNPEVIKVGDRYFCFSDPPGYPTKSGESRWMSRQLREAVSDDGIHWTKLGYIPPDNDADACHVPQALVTNIDGKRWLYLFYATQIGYKKNDGKYHYQYDRIRAMRREVIPVAK